MKRVFICSLLAAAFFAASFCYAKSFPFDGDFSAGAYAGEDKNDAYIDLLIPFFGNETSFIFLSPRLSMTGKELFGSSANEVNIGVGLRKYFSNVFKEGAIIGVNVYYDARNSDIGKNYQQAGAGIEFLSAWFDIRANAYFPFGNDQYYTGKTYNLPTLHYIGATYSYEVSLTGYDGELGFKIPLPQRFGALRLFAGYYYFTADKIAEDIKGYKARAQYSPLKILKFNYEIYDNKELNGSHWQAGAEISVPVDFRQVFRAKNPFKNLFEYVKSFSKPVKERIGENVRRDMYVRTANAAIKHYEDKLRNDNG
ncbi:MAG: inverse autotransporter beta domain-containing protein, partial [Endomicrobium sp.]|nr:inverse autotransporter beta domain-containing protein [Endomicrobium sp.]